MPTSSISWYPDRRDAVSWEVAEVVHDLGAGPQLVIRIELSGVAFPHRALEPFVQVGKVRSRLALVDADGLQVRAYFNRPVPSSDDIRFGYGEQDVFIVHGRYRVDMVDKLDRKRLPTGVQFYDPLEAVNGERPR